MKLLYKKRCSKINITQSCRTRLTNDLKKIGLSFGDTVLVHTSIKGLLGDTYHDGNTDDITSNDTVVSAEDIIHAIIDVIGVEGTLLVPALSYESVTEKNPIFDVQKTKTCIGALPELFRTNFATHRSVHPTHSVCALGELACVLTARHHHDNTPVGENSPFMLMTKVNAKILMLGCGLFPNTFMHGVEEAAQASYPLSKEMLEYTIIKSDLSEYKKKYYTHNFKGLIQRYDRLENLMEPCDLKKGKVLNSMSYLINAQKALEIGKNAIKQNDMYFIDNDDS